MKSPYVNELQPNQQATGVFLVHSKEVRQKKSGDLYLSLMLGDRTGDLDAKMWDSVSEVMDTFDRDDFVRVKGVLNVYQNRLQLTIHKMQRVEESEIDPADFFPHSHRDLDEMFGELQAVDPRRREPAPSGRSWTRSSATRRWRAFTARRRRRRRCITPISAGCWNTSSPSPSCAA